MTRQAEVTQKQPILVLGATGSFGGAVTAELLARGIPTRVLVRDRQKLEGRYGSMSGLEVLEGDVQNIEHLRRAAKGCKTIVHGVNYLYHQWFPQMETATRNILEVAETENALLVFPGNVYALGHAGNKPFDESASNKPVSRKGELRQWMEEELKAYAGSGGRVLIMRAGDYFGPTARNGYIDPLFGAAASGKMMTALGNLDLPHQWAYMPDLGRATVDIMLDPQKLSAWEVVNFVGTVVPSQRAFMSDIARIAQSPDRVLRLPWWLLKGVSLFSPLIREVMEMKYLWESTVLIDGPRFRDLLPDFQPTPTDQAIAETIESYRAEMPVTGSTGAKRQMA